MTYTSRVFYFRPFLALICLCVGYGCDANFDVIIDSVQTVGYNFPNNDQTLDCDQKDCERIKFSLPNMKFWEVWKEDNVPEESSDQEVSTNPPHWPNPPAFWGESVMGRQKKKDTRRKQAEPSNSSAANGPIITKLDNIVDILRPVSDTNNNNWISLGSENIMHKLKPQSRYDTHDVIYEDIDDKTGDKIAKRNLKKIIIEESADDNSKSFEKVYKKKKSKKKRSKIKDNIPTFIIEEELLPEDEEEVVEEEETDQNEQDVIYKIMKSPKPKPKPKPKTKQIFIEDQTEDIEPEVIPKVVIQKMPLKREKPKDLLFVNENYVPYDEPVVYLTSTSTTTTTTTTTTTPRPLVKKKKKKRKTQTQREDKNVVEDKSDDEEEYEYEEYDVDEESPDEQAWGSASPETKVNMNPHRRQRLNPLNVLRRLRPPPRRAPHPRPIRPQMAPNHMIPGGTFRMRFYMDGNQNDY